MRVFYTLLLTSDNAAPALEVLSLVLGSLLGYYLFDFFFAKFKKIRRCY